MKETCLLKSSMDRAKRHEEIFTLSCGFPVHEVRRPTGHLKMNYVRMGKIIFSVIFLFMATGLMNATIPEDTRENGVISGKVADNDSKTPLPYATVTLSKPNDTIILVGVTSDDHGAYNLKEVPYGRYDVKISFIGYSPVYIKNVLLGRNSNPLDLGTTALRESSSSIAEVAIVQERVKGEQMIDKTVYTINDDVRNASSSGLNILRHIPAVTVDFQENVTLEGSSNILFYVDGIERNKDFIAQIDPQLIDKVEIISNPGVKYSADVTGVINIVLKKTRRYGISGSAKADLSHPQRVLLNPRANLEYGTPNFRVYTGTRAHYEKFQGELAMTTRKELDANLTFFDKKGVGGNVWQNGLLNYGADWFLSDRSSLNFYGEWRGFKGNENNFNYYEKLYENNTQLHQSNYIRNASNRGGSLYYSMFFKQKLDDNGSELNIQASYYDYLSETDEKFSNYVKTNMADNTSTTAPDWRERIQNFRDYTEMKIDYARVGEKVKQEAGFQSFYQWMKNEKLLTFMEGLEKFNYNEMRNIAYYSAIGKMGKVTLQGGVRVEHSLINTPEKSNIQYTSFLPQTNVSYAIKEGRNLKLTYRRQVYRPSIERLNPLETYMDSLHVRTGNPDLKPAIDNRLQLEYSMNFKSNYFAPRIYATYTSNGIGDYSYEAGNINMITQANVLDRYEYGIALNGAFQLAKFWRLNIYTSAYERIIMNDHIAGEKMKKLTADYSITSLFMFPKNWTIFATSFYRSPNIEYQRTFLRDPLFIFGVDKRFNQKANLSVFYNPFIRDFSYLKIITEYENTYETYEGKIDIWQVFGIEFTYNFNYGKEIRKVNRSTQYDQDGNGGTF